MGRKDPEDDSKREEAGLSPDRGQSEIRLGHLDKVTGRRMVLQRKRDDLKGLWGIGAKKGARGSYLAIF